jgi:hypothetical protein
MRIIAEPPIDEALQRIRQVDEIEAGARRFPYSQLEPGDFELLVYLLFHDRLTREDFYDSATLAITGADKGRDVVLRRNETPVGVIQCKGRSIRLDAKAALREAVKFLLLAADDPDFDGGFDGFRYVLAVASDPATTTVDLFSAPMKWIESHQTDVEQAIRSLASKYSRLGNIDSTAVLPEVQAGLLAMRYTLLRPAELDSFIVAAPDTFRHRFFRPRLVVADLDTVRAAVSGRESGTTVSLSEGGARRRLASDVTALMVRRMSRAGVYKRNRTIRRPTFETELARFLRSDAPIFPVVGMSGVGKSSALAELAERDDPELPPRLIVRGADIAAGHESLSDLLARLPWADAGCDLAAREAIQALSTNKSEPLLVVLDGLNEAAITPAQIRNSWLPNTFEWLSTRRVKLLLSCRPELWSSLELAIPAELTHRPPAPVGSEQIDAASPKPPSVFRLGDFTRGEAAEALKAYGFSDRLGIDQATHPFILFVLDALGSETDLGHMALLEILETLIRTKVARALERLGQPTWQAQVMTSLEAVASDMNRQRTQVVGGHAVGLHFGRYIDAADALAEEHILTPTEGGYRFQHDQVREFLQARSLTLEALEGFIPRLPPPLRLPHFSMWRYSRYQARRKRALRRSRFGELSPSVAALAATSALSVEPERTAGLLYTIWAATSPKEDSVVRDWARQLILAFLSYAPGAALGKPAFFGWFSRLLEEDRTPEHYGWTDHLTNAAVEFLARGAVPLPTKLTFLPTIFLRENDFNWSKGDLRSEAWSDRQHDREDLPRHSYKFEDTAAFRLVSHLVAVDPTATIANLGSLLKDQRLLPQTPTYGQQRDSVSIGTCAKRCLFKLRREWINQIAAAALSSNSVEAGELAEGLAAANPEELAAGCLEQLRKGDSLIPHEIERALWLAASSPYLSDEEALLYALRGLNREHGDGFYIVWAARIFFARRERHKWLCAADPRFDDFCRLVKDFSSYANTAVIYLRAHLQINPDTEHISEDYLYILEEDFEAGFAILETQLASDQGLKPLACSAIAKFLAERRLDEPERRSKFAKLVAVLERYLDLQGRKAAETIAGFVIEQARHAGLNKEYYIGADDALTLGLISLAKHVIRLGGETVSHKCSSMFCPKDRRIRKELFSALRAADLQPKHVSDLIYSLCTSQPFAGRATAPYIISLRTAGREADWDIGAQRYLYHGSGLGPRGLKKQIVSFWRRMPSDQLTPLSAAILSRADDGQDLRDAADPMALRAFITPR